MYKIPAFWFLLLTLAESWGDHSPHTARLVKADCVTSFSPGLGSGERNTSLVTGYWKSSAFISGSWQCGRMIHMKEAEGIVFQKWSLKTDYFLSLTPCQGLDTSNIWDVMEPTNHCLPRVSLGLPEDSMLDFSSVFITRCKLLMALICLVIDLSRLDSDRVSDLIEIKNALLDLVEIMGKLLS